MRIWMVALAACAAPAKPAPSSPAPANEAPPPSSSAGRVVVAATDAFDHTSLTADLLRAKIESAYLPGIARCYRAEPDPVPKVRNGVRVKFTVLDSGNVTVVSAGGLTASIEHCVEGLVASWRFPAPRDASGEPTTAEFSIQLVLEQ